MSSAERVAMLREIGLRSSTGHEFRRLSGEFRSPPRFSSDYRRAAGQDSHSGYARGPRDAAQLLEDARERDASRSRKREREVNTQEVSRELQLLKEESLRRVGLVKGKHVSKTRASDHHYGF